MDKSRWFASYLIGLVAGELVGKYSHGVWYWVIVYAAPALAMLIEVFRSVQQDAKNEGWA